MRRFHLPAAALILCLPVAASRGANDFMVRLDLDGRPVEGAPIAWDEQQVMLLARDGQLLTFAPEEAKNFRATAASFRGLSPGEMRAELMREFGRRFEVSGTGQYLVVHPTGQRDRWAARFEELYRSFVHYFSVRGLSLRPPDVPLAAVVFYNRQDFYRYAAANGVRLGPGTLGYYSPRTNRIMMYDPDAGLGDDNWHQAKETIIHEAAHQSAFNTGVHSRYTAPPLWAAEGLGTLFEAPGVCSSRLHPRREDRINRYRLDAFRRFESTRKAGWLGRMVAHDWAFRRDPERAYADAWALTFFLTETRPRQYAEYLRRTADKPPFLQVDAAAREQDFRRVFGDNLALLEAEVTRFLATLP